MYHNYLVLTPTANLLISIDVGTVENCAFAKDGFVRYYGNYPLYMNKGRMGDVSNLILPEENIALSFRTEELT